MAAFAKYLFISLFVMISTSSFENSNIISESILLKVLTSTTKSQNKEIVDIYDTNIEKPPTNVNIYEYNNTASIKKPPTNVNIYEYKNTASTVKPPTNLNVHEYSSTVKPPINVKYINTVKPLTNVKYSNIVKSLINTENLHMEEISKKNDYGNSLSNFDNFNTGEPSLSIFDKKKILLIYNQKMNIVYILNQIWFVIAAIIIMLLMWIIKIIMV